MFFVRKLSWRWEPWKRQNWGLFAKVDCGAASPATTSFGEDTGAFVHLLYSSSYTSDDVGIALLLQEQRLLMCSKNDSVVYMDCRI